MREDCLFATGGRHIGVERSSNRGILLFTTHSEWSGKSLGGLGKIMTAKTTLAADP